MSYLKSYVDSLDNCGLQQSVLATSNAVYDNVQKHFDCRISTTGLLLGNVQSGKTGQMLGIMSKYLFWFKYSFRFIFKIK